MDMLRALATPNMDIRKKTLDIALDLITSRNIDEARPGRQPGLPCAPRWQCRASLAVPGAASPPGREPERRSVRPPGAPLWSHRAGAGGRGGAPAALC